LVARADAQTAAPPEIVGRLVGPGVAPSPSGLRLYGTDLGWTFEHQGQLVMLFGDTWPTARSLCEGEPRNDDTVATLPLARPAGVPPLTFVTRSEAPEQFAPMVVLRGAESLPMAYGQVPLAGFSDGTRGLAILGRGQVVRCTRGSPRSAPACARQEGLACTQEVGECLPSVLEVPALCDRATGAGCLPGTTCQPSPAGFCVDPTSSQHDGSPGSLRFAVAHDQEIVVQDPAQASLFHSVARLATNKFINATARTVQCFTGRRCGGNYRSGYGAVLVWGRPLFTGEQGRQAQLYLMAHRLPLRPGRRGRLRPRYYAGVDASGEPRWTRRQSEAVPLALDGVVGGSPHEEQPIVSQMAISWIGAPVNKWVMLYGGDLADYLLADAANARPGPAPGAIRIRFADHPWDRGRRRNRTYGRAARRWWVSRTGRAAYYSTRSAWTRDRRCAPGAIRRDRRTSSCPAASPSVRCSTSGASTDPTSSIRTHRPSGRAQRTSSGTCRRGIPTGSCW